MPQAKSSGNSQTLSYLTLTFSVLVEFSDLPFLPDDKVAETVLAYILACSRSESTPLLVKQKSCIFFSVILDQSLTVSRPSLSQRQLGGESTAAAPKMSPWVGLKAALFQHIIEIFFSPKNMGK